MQIEKVDVLYEGWEKHLLLTVRLEGGKIRTFQVDDHGDAAAVLAYDPARKVAALVRQHRPPMIYAGSSARLLEIPAGLTDGEDPEVAARREVLEEVGIGLHALEHLADLWALPGISTERVSLFLAPYSAADRVGSGGGIATEDENIEVEEVALAELARMADAGELVDLKTFAAVQTLRLRRPELFR